MKKLLCLLLLAGITKTQAQDSTAKKIKELYLSVSSFSPLNLRIQYKHQMQQRTFFKAGLINLSYTDAQTKSYSGIYTVNTHQMNFSGGIALGLEYRTNLYKDFAIFHGPGIGFTNNTVVTKIKQSNFPGEQTNTSTYYTTNLVYTLGFLFHLRDHFYLSAELSPGFTYSYPGNSNTVINFSLNNSGLLSLAYRL